ncbi:MAG: hypothetical protein PHD82_17160, partial [Candidatus Riflebacteria bacterium]|nr:hypothetical protein [Candidatus Riflebacteria bacterium]
MFSYGRIRTAFAYAFPLVLGILYILAGDQVLQNHSQKVRQAQTSELLNRASLIAANLKSEYSASLQIEKAFLQVF